MHAFPLFPLQVGQVYQYGFDWGPSPEQFKAGCDVINPDDSVSWKPTFILGWGRVPILSLECEINLFITGFLLINPFLVGSDYIPSQLQLLKLPHLIHPHCHQIWEPHWPAMMLPHSECEQGPVKASYSKAMRKVQCWHNVAIICENCQHRSCSHGGESKVFVCVNMSVHMLVFACMTIWQMGMHLNSVIYTNYCLSMSFSSFIVRCMNIKQEKVCIDRNKKEGNWKRRKHKEQSQNMYMFVCHVCWLRG